MNRFIVLILALSVSLLGSGCQLLGALGVETAEDVEAQEQADLSLLATAFVLTQSDDSSAAAATCDVTSSGGGSNVTVTETVYSVSGTTNLFTGDDARAQSAVYFALSNVSSGDTFTVNNFGNWVSNSGEGTIAFYDYSCPLDTTTTTAYSSGSEYTDSMAASFNDNSARTLTINTAGTYLVQFYTGTGVGTSNGENATIVKN